MHEFNQSLKYDKRMYDADIRGSIAYSKALTLVGILTKDEEVKIVNGLEAVKKEWDDGVVSPDSTLASRPENPMKLTRNQTVPGPA
jgi:argininosuccinate lyase